MLRVYGRRLLRFSEVLLKTLLIVGCISCGGLYHVVTLDVPGIQESREMYFIQGKVMDFCLVNQLAVGAIVSIVGNAGEELTRTSTRVDGSFVVYRRDLTRHSGEMMIQVENGASLG